MRSAMVFRMPLPGAPFFRKESAASRWSAVRFAYDSEDRLKSMNCGAVTIVYDGDGHRVEKIATGSVSQSK